MKTIDTHSLLKQKGYRDTQPRRLVLDALTRIGHPASPYDLQKWLKKRGTSMNAVTIYRVVDVFEKLGIVHRHPTTGLFSLCALQDVPGHHGFLRCKKCDGYQEFHSSELCKAENLIAKRAGYIPDHHVSEIVGTCSDCQ